MAIPPGTEWTCLNDDELAEALIKILRLAGMSQEALSKEVGSQTMNGYLRRENSSVRTNTLFKALAGCGLQLVLRAPAKTKMRDRLAGQS